MAFKLTEINGKAILKTLAGYILNIVGIKDLNTATSNVANNRIDWTLQLYTNTAANFTSTNPVLLVGQLGIETDGLATSPKFKIGDGTTAWSSLPYSSASATTWGSITGTLSSQTDLQSALNLKANIASPTFTGTTTIGALVVPNSATANRISYATSNNVLGESSSLTFDGTAQLTVGGVTLGTYGGEKGIVNSAGKDFYIITDLNKSIRLFCGTQGIVISPDAGVTTDFEIVYGGYSAYIKMGSNLYFYGSTGSTNIGANGVSDYLVISSVGQVKIKTELNLDFATINTVPYLNASKNLISSSVTPTELGYLSGVTSAIQTQIDTKTNKLITYNTQTASYTLVLTDADKLVEMNVASSNNLTVPPNSSVSFQIGTQILIKQYGVGNTTFVPGSGVTINSFNGLRIAGQHGIVTLIKRGTNEWDLTGNTIV